MNGWSSRGWSVYLIQVAADRSMSNSATEIARDEQRIARISEGYILVFFFTCTASRNRVIVSSTAAPEGCRHMPAPRSAAESVVCHGVPGRQHGELMIHTLI